MSESLASNLYLVWSALALAFASAAWWRVRHVGPLVPLVFFGGWIAGEMALQFVALHALVTLGAALAGALSNGTGVLALALNLSGCGLLIACHLRGIAARDEAAAFGTEAGLDVDAQVSTSHGWRRPFNMKRSGVRRVKDVAYGESLPGDKGGRNLLDVIMPETPGERRPILLQIHGGGWIIGDKREQGGPLMGYLAERGWVCFAINYRLSPKAKFPDHIVDVKRALAWIREHAEEYGGDPDFICVTGGSAGGHLTALTALSANDPVFQPGFEQADTRVAAAVPFYGVFDFRDRAGHRGSQSMEPMLTKRVFQCSPDENPELWDAMTPLTRVSSEAPPFMVVQGTHDSLVYVEEARDFVRALRDKSQNAVHYLEMEGAQHAFDTFHCVRGAHAVRGVAAFLQSEHERFQNGGA